LFAVAAVVALTGVFATSASALPIVSTGVPTLPSFSGAAATPNKIEGAKKPEQNPFMAPNPASNIHNDTWMTDAYWKKGPIGANPVTDSYSYPSALCGSLTFDSMGRIVTVCPSILYPPQVRIIDAETLAPIDTLDLPNAETPAGTPEYQNFAGGGYFYLDKKDRIWVATKTDHLYMITNGADHDTLTVKRDYDLTPYLDTETERISSALPDFDGNLWFVSKANGKVGILNLDTGKAKVVETGEQIQNSFTITSDGIYIVSEKKMYRWKADSKGKPKVVWSKKYPNSGIHKPGQADAGSGTTPTILHGGYVAITDNADPMDVVVYRTKKNLTKGEKRVVCTTPVFEKGASATENSLMGAGPSLIVENNYGYQDPFGPNAGAPTTPGFARIDVKKNGKGCKKVWTNTEVQAPTVVPKLSTKTGLIYTYARPTDPGAQGYYWTTIDYETGETVFQQYAGSGLTFNNNYAGLALGPNGDAYLGVIGGIIRLRDGS
jgi:hypothetical protein